MSNTWRIRVAFVATVLAAALLSLVLIATAHPKVSKHEKLSARAKYLADQNPLVILQTPNTRIVRAVVGDKLFVMMFEKRGGVWFYSSSKPASGLTG